MSARELAILIAVCLAWGLHFVVVKLAVTEIPPIFYAAMRMTLVAALMVPFLRWRPGQMIKIACAGLCLGSLNYAFLFTGVGMATASTAAIAIELHVPFATILAVIFLKDRVGLPRIAGMTLAFAGVALIALAENDAPAATNHTLGLFLVACGAFMEAVGAVLVKKIGGFKPLELLAWFALIGAVTLWGLTFTVERDHAEALARADTTLVVAAIVYSAFAASIFGHSAYYWLLQRLPVSIVSPSVLLTTLFAVFFGVVLLGEPLGLHIMIGGMMVIVGVGVVLLRNSAKRDIKATIHEPGTPV